MTSTLDRRRSIAPAAAALLLALVLALPGSARAQEADTIPLPDTTETPDTVEVGPRSARTDTTANFTGTVASSRTGEPIQGARVTIPELEYGAITDGQGKFRVESLPPGTYDVRVKYLGYSTNRRPVRLRPGRVTTATFMLERDVLKVADLEVTVKEPEPRDRMAGFKRRMKKGFGEFITREEIEERRPRNTSDLFRNVPGVEVGRLTYGRAPILMSRGARSCEPVLYLDGVLRREFAVDNLDPEAIQGIEIYRRMSEVPPQFQGSSSCGVLVVHTRVQSTEPGELGGGG